MNGQTATSSTLSSCVEAARAAGAPPDQVRRFLTSGYAPTRKGWEFHALARAADLPGGPEYIGLGGARGPGKSHTVFGQVALDDCQRFPGLKVLFLRLVGRAAREAFEDLVGRVLTSVSYRYIASQGRLEFPNGSRIILGGFKDSSDIDVYLGVEYDLIVIEEATQLTWAKVQMLLGSLRSSKPNWRARMYLTTNPGGVGHAWFKQMFVTPHRTGTASQARFVPATYLDNPFLSPEYIRFLEGLRGPLARAWREGDWDTFEGMAFPTWDYERHVVRPFEIPPHWSRYRGIDWGYAAPFACLWGARNPDNGRVVVYRELYINPQEGDTALMDRQQAERIKEMTPQGEKISLSFGDPSLWETKTDGMIPTSTAEIYLQNGIYLIKGNNRRLNGKRKVDRLLADLPDGRPGILIFENCANLIRTLPLLPYDAVNVEDVNTHAEDHAYDALRYLLTPIRDAPTPEEQEQRKRKQQSPLVSLKGLVY